MVGYRKTYAASLADPESFWREQSELVDWFARPRQVLDSSRAPFHRWFAGGTLNTCYNALDRHVIKGRAEQTARSMTALSPTRSAGSPMPSCSNG